MSRFAHVMWRSAALLCSLAFFAACPLPTDSKDDDQAAGEPWTLTVTTIGSGAVTRSPDLASYPDGTAVTLTALPASDWAFRDWSGDVDARENPVTVTITANTSVTATFYELVSRSSGVATCALSGAPNDGEVWTVRCSGNECSHVVSGLETLNEVAAGIAAEIDLLDGVIAGTEEATIACVSLAGAPVDMELTVTSTASAVVEIGAALSKLVHLAGSAPPGEAWSIILDGISLSCTAQAGDTPADVAVCLAASVDSFPDYVGGTEEATVVVTRVSGGAFAISATAPEGGEAVVDESTATVTRVELSGAGSVGDTWSVAVAELTATWVVQAGDTAAGIAAELAAQLDTADGFTAGSEVERIVVTKVEGGEFSLTANVVPSGGGTIDTGTATAVALSPSAPVVTGDTWVLTVDATEYVRIVQAGDSAGTLAAALAAMVNAASGYVAGSEGGTVSVTKLSGESLDASLVVTP